MLFFSHGQISDFLISRVLIKDAASRPNLLSLFGLFGILFRGKSLWRKSPMSHEASYGNPFNVPVVVWDLDGDGKAEVICRLEEDHRVYLAVLDGMTGHVLRKTP